MNLEKEKLLKKRRSFDDRTEDHFVFIPLVRETESLPQWVSSTLLLASAYFSTTFWYCSILSALCAPRSLCMTIRRL